MHRARNTLTTCSFLVRPIFAVLFLVAQLGSIDAQRLPVRSALRTPKFVSRTFRHHAGFLVGTVLAIFVTVAMIRYGDAECIGASELIAGARREIYASLRSLSSITLLVL